MLRSAKLAIAAAAATAAVPESIGAAWIRPDRECYNPGELGLDLSERVFGGDLVRTEPRLDSCLIRELGALAQAHREPWAIRSP